MQEFFCINLTSVVFIQTFMTYKAYASAKKKEKMAKKPCLINKLTELQSKHMINPTNTVEQKTEPKAILHEENTFALFQLRC